MAGRQGVGGGRWRHCVEPRAIVVEFLWVGGGEKTRHTWWKTRRRRGGVVPGCDGDPPHLVVNVKRVVHHVELKCKMVAEWPLDLIESASCFGVLLPSILFGCFMRGSKSAFAAPLHIHIGVRRLSCLEDVACACHCAIWHNMTSWYLFAVENEETDGNICILRLILFAWRYYDTRASIEISSLCLR